jgi:hypothetical protein
VYEKEGKIAVIFFSQSFAKKLCSRFYLVPNRLLIGSKYECRIGQRVFALCGV